jgi:hypothetical protein
MQKDSDRSLFEVNMFKEILDFLKTETVQIVPHSSISSGNKPLQPKWSFHRKRAPNWSVIKHKSLCPNGSIQG